MDRRTAIQLAGLGVLSSRLAAAQHQMHTLAKKPGEYKPQFFSAEEHKLLDALSEMILPADERSGGARAARVADYIDLVAANSGRVVQERWRSGAAAFQARGKLDLDAVAREDPATSAAARFFADTRRATIFAYYSSRVGLIDELGYQGNQVMAGFAGCTTACTDVVADTARVTWMASKPAGALREALNELAPRLARLRVVRLRVFAAGAERSKTGEEVARLKLAPALTVVPVSGFAGEGRFVVEATVEGRSIVNPRGLALVSGQPVQADGAGGDVMPLIAKSFDKLDVAHAAVAAKAADVLRVTCFCTSEAGMGGVAALVKKRYPAAACVVARIPAVAGRTLVECESAVRAGWAPGELVHPEGLEKSPNYSQVAVLAPGKAVWSSAVYGSLREPKAMFAELDRRLRSAGSAVAQTAMSCLYPVAAAGSEAIRNSRFEFYDRARPPASTMLVFGPGDADELAVDVVARITR
jgi:hypothetical protein